jgi:hypothetical protein
MRLWLLGVVAVLAAAGVSAADDKSDAVVKKAIEAHGGADTLNKYTAGKFTMKGDISVMGMDLQFSGDMGYTTDKYRMNIEMKVMDMTITVRQVMAGGKGKRTVKAGDNVLQAQDIEDEEMKMALLGREMQRLTPLLDAKRFTVRAADDEDVNGKKAAVLLVTPKALDREFKLLFDKDSGLLVKTGHKGKAAGGEEVYQETLVSDYKKVNGVQVGHKIELTHDGKKFMTATMADVEVLEKLDDKEFKADD